MKQDEIIRMAREAGFEYAVDNERWYRFAALVAAHEREKALRQEHGVPDTVSPLDFVVGSVKQAVLAEREACAKVCDDMAKCCFVENPARKVVESIAAAIRARGN